MSECKRDFADDRKICEAATDETWPGVMETTAVICGVAKTVYAFYVWSKEDVAFVAAAREGWPAALDEIDRLKTDYDQAISDMETWMQAAKEAQAQNAVLRQALDEVVSELIANNRVEFENGQVCGLVSEEVENKAVNALAETPAQAAERVGALVEALRFCYDATTKDKGLTMHEATRIYAEARDALNKWEGK